MANLFWNHPNGDTITTPCIHVSLQHPGGDTINVPCTHPLVRQHDHDTVRVGPVNQNVPCTHWVVPHPGGDPKTVPCTHPVVQHPAGDQTTGPCIHPYPIDSVDRNGALVFYTNNQELKNFVNDGINRISGLGANVLGWGPLKIFNRPAINGNPNDANDPFWSHYESPVNAIQITQGLTGIPLRDTLFHEMGHLLVGRSSVQIPNPGNVHGMHNPTSPGEAMSEGWAHFVGAAMLNPQSSITPIFKGENWETIAPGYSPNPNIEYSVGMCLWDLYDLFNDGNDMTSFSFLTLYKVFMPTFPTHASGPVIPDIFDFCNRLKLNNPKLADAINKVRIKNVGS